MNTDLRLLTDKWIIILNESFRGVRCMYVYMYVCIYDMLSRYSQTSSVCMYLYMYVCVYTCTALYVVHV